MFWNKKKNETTPDPNGNTNGNHIEIDNTQGDTPELRAELRSRLEALGSVPEEVIDELMTKVIESGALENPDKVKSLLSITQIPEALVNTPQKTARLAFALLAGVCKSAPSPDAMAKLVAECVATAAQPGLFNALDAAAVIDGIALGIAMGVDPQTAIDEGLTPRDFLGACVPTCIEDDDFIELMEEKKKLDSQRETDMLQSMFDADAAEIEN